MLKNQARNQAVESNRWAWTLETPSREHHKYTLGYTLGPACMSPGDSSHLHEVHVIRGDIPPGRSDKTGEQKDMGVNGWRRMFGDSNPNGWEVIVRACLVYVHK